MIATNSDSNPSTGNIYIYIYIIIACIFLARLFVVVYDHLGAPFDLFFESPNLSTIKLIKAGKNPYDQDIYSNLPLNITLYTPLYHYITSVLPILEGNPFFFGRIVSLLSMFIASFVLFFVNKKTQIKALPFIAISIFFSFWPVSLNTAFLKNDPMALLFSVYAVLLVSNSKNSSSIVLSALCCVLALATKQSYISSSIACLIYLFLSNRRYFYMFLISISVFSIIFVSIAMFAWGTGFWFSTVFALRQEIIYRFGYLIFKHLLKQPLFCFLIGLNFFIFLNYIKKSPKKILTESPYFIYVMVSGCILVLTIGKRGASSNYFIEFYLSQLMWIIFAFKNTDYVSLKRPAFYAVTGIFALCSIGEIKFARTIDYSFANQKFISTQNDYYKIMTKEIESFGIRKPILLDIMTHLHVYSISDNLHLNDPYLYNLLWEDKILSYKPLLISIKEGYFDIIMLPSNIIYKNQLNGPRKIIVNEILRHYRLEKIGFDYIYYIRKTSAPLLSMK